jgi:hypothetical protein
VPYFLDGNNLLGGARPSEERRDAIIREICDRLRRTRARVTLFFDGPPAGVATSLGNLAIRFAGKRTADESILSEIAKSRSPADIVVVTADRELARRAKEAGAKRLEPDAFWRRFGATPDSGGDEGPPAADVEEWARYFEDERNREPP